MTDYFVYNKSKETALQSGGNDDNRCNMPVI